jgi:hypothetical protein
MEEEDDATVMTGIFLGKDQLLSQKTGTGIKANGKKAPKKLIHKRSSAVKGKVGAVLIKGDL